MRISFFLTLACVLLLVAPPASQACDRTATVTFAGEPCHAVGGSLVSIRSGRTLAFVDTRGVFSLGVRSAHFRAPVFVPVHSVGGPVVQQKFRRAIFPGNRLKSQTVR